MTLAGSRPNKEPDLSQKIDGGTRDENDGKVTAQAAKIMGSNRQYVSALLQVEGAP